MSQESCHTSTQNPHALSNLCFCIVSSPGNCPAQFRVRIMRVSRPSRLFQKARLWIENSPTFGGDGVFLKSSLRELVVKPQVKKKTCKQGRPFTTVPRGPGSLWSGHMLEGIPPQNTQKIEQNVIKLCSTLWNHLISFLLSKVHSIVKPYQPNIEYTRHFVVSDFFVTWANKKRILLSIILVASTGILIMVHYNLDITGE